MRHDHHGRLAARIRLALASAALLGIGLATTPAPAQVLFSPDITATLGPTLSALVSDEDVASDDGAGTVLSMPLVMISALPAGAEIAGFEYSTPFGWYLTLDTTAVLPGLPPGTPAEPRDVVLWDIPSASFSIAFDGSASSVPAGARIDALSVDMAGNLVLSFDVTLMLPGAGVIDDEDLVRFSGGLYTLVFDGGASGVPAQLDLDAAQQDGSNLLLSFDASGNIAGIDFDDEDVLVYDTISFAWSIFFDGSASDPANWPAADLVAVPEPGVLTTLAGGALYLSLLNRLRRRRP